MENSTMNKLKIGKVLKIYNEFEVNYYMLKYDVDALVEIFQLDPDELGLE